MEEFFATSKRTTKDPSACLHLTIFLLGINFPGEKIQFVNRNSLSEFSTIAAIGDNKKFAIESTGVFDCETLDYFLIVDVAWKKYVNKIIVTILFSI